MVFAHRAMAGLADFDLDTFGQFRRKPEARAENFQDERIADADKFQPAADTHAERLETLRILVIRLHAAHHGANARRQGVEPDERNWFGKSCHD